MTFFLSFLIAFLLAIIFTLIIKKIAWHFKILDYPQSDAERKIHEQTTPLLGGLAIFLTFFLMIFILILINKNYLINVISLKNLIGIFIASLIIMLGGFLDDKYNLKPQKQIIFPILAILIVIISGIGIKFMTNPLGGIIHLDMYKFEILKYHGLPYYFTFPTDIFTFIWLMVMMYSTKFLDGLDGLVSGMSVIGGLIIAGLCFLTKFYQPSVGLLSLLFAGACLGFLIFNFHPAKIFLGEAGSLFCGFILGILAIISGGKIATTLFILGIPVLDLFFVCLRRIFIERRSPFRGDNKHLHFRLLAAGFSQRKAVLIFYFIAAVFGIISLFLKSQQKLLALCALFILTIILFAFLNRDLWVKRVEKK